MSHEKKTPPSAKVKHDDAEKKQTVKTGADAKGQHDAKRDPNAKHDRNEKKSGGHVKK